MSRYGWSSSLGQISPQTVLSTMSGDGDERPYLEVTHLPGDGFVPVDMTEFRGHTKPDLTTRHTSVADMRDLGLLGKKEDTPSLSGLRQHTPSSPSLRPRAFPQVIGKKRPLQSIPEASKQPNKRVVTKDLGLSTHSSNTLGILKEPSLAKEAGQGLLQAISAYSRKDLGGNFTWRPTSEQAQNVNGGFKCTFNGCDKHFAKIEYLHQHMLSHDIKFTCDHPDCNKTFARYDLLDRHQRSHDRRHTGSTDPVKSSPRYTSNGYYSNNTHLPHGTAPEAQAKEMSSNKPQPAGWRSTQQVPQVNVAYVKPTKEQLLSQPLPDDVVAFETPPPLAQELSQKPWNKATKWSSPLGEVHTEAHKSRNIIKDWLQHPHTAEPPRHFPILPARDENGFLRREDLFETNGNVYNLQRHPDGGTYVHLGRARSPTPTPPYQPMATPRRAANILGHARSTRRRLLNHDVEKMPPVQPIMDNNRFSAEKDSFGLKTTALVSSQNFPEQTLEEYVDLSKLPTSTPPRRPWATRGHARGAMLSGPRYPQDSPQVNDQGGGRVLNGLAHTISEDMSDKRKLEKYRLCALRSTFNGFSAGKPKKR